MMGDAFSNRAVLIDDNGDIFITDKKPTARVIYHDNGTRDFDHDPKNRSFPADRVPNPEKRAAPNPSQKRLRF